MNPTYLDAAAVVAVAVAVLLSVTTLAMRRSPTAGGRAPTRGVTAGMLAALPTWGGVLVTVLLAVRGKLALAGIAMVATIVHVGIARVRAALAEGGEGPNR